MEWSILEALNGHRTAAGLPLLTMDQPLCGLASIRASEYIQTQSASRPDGRDWSTVLSDYDYALWSHTEELRLYASLNFPASLLVEIWMNNADAKAQILSADYGCCGIGIANDGTQMYITVILAG